MSVISVSPVQVMSGCGLDDSCFASALELPKPVGEVRRPPDFGTYLAPDNAPDVDGARFRMDF